MDSSNEVVIIGINHFDPFGPEKVTAILRQLEQQQFIPDIVCVEWKEDLAQAILLQRANFAAQMRMVFPQLSEEDGKRFERALAFEADIHTEIFPNARTVWLDNDRKIQCTDGVVTNFSKNRVNVYKQCVREDVTADINQITNAILVAAYSDGRCTPRDMVFYKRYQEDACDGSAVLCIVGANHGDVCVDGTFAQLIQQSGKNVTFFDTTII